MNLNRARLLTLDFKVGVQRISVNCIGSAQHNKIRKKQFIAAILRELSNADLLLDQQKRSVKFFFVEPNFLGFTRKYVVFIPKVL